MSAVVVDGNAAGFRASVFLLPAALVPVIAHVRAGSPYPHTADVLLAARFLVDTIVDLLPSSAGGLLGSIIGVIWFGPRH